MTHNIDIAGEDFRDDYIAFLEQLTKEEKLITHRADLQRWEENGGRIISEQNYV
jgi:hypothetical protein